MRFLRKHIKALIGILIVVCLGIGVTVVLLRVRQNNTKAYVEPVSYYNNTWILSSNTDSGMITDGATQNIVVSTLDQVAEVYVQEGDSVSKGDKLFSYDTKLLSLNVDEAKLDLEAAQQTYDSEQKKLDRYMTMESMSPEEIKQVQEYVENTEAQKYQEYLSAMEAAESAAEAEWEKNHDEDEEFDALSWEESYMEANPYKETEYKQLTEYDDNYYTDEQKAELIAKQKVVVLRAQAGVRAAEIHLEEAENKVKDASVRATMDGTVTKMSDPENPPLDGSAFAIITSASGVSVSGTISEFQLGEVSVGDRISVYDYMTGNTAEAEIVSISPYPDTSNNFYVNGNQNASLYPYSAVLDVAEGFNSGDGVEITHIEDEAMDDVIILDSVYVRGDSEGSYVMIDDGTGHLKKQRVTTKSVKSSWGDSYSQILSGLSQEDLIAFPYGDSAKEGNLTTTEYSSGLFGGLIY